MRAASLREPRSSGGDLSAGQRGRLLAWNAFPLLQVLVAATLVLAPWGTPALRCLAALFWILVVPPLLARVLLAGERPAGRIAPGSRDFFRWWAVSSLQALFNRMPWIEEGLRLVPGLYSAWLRLWGAGIGRLTYWGPGARVLDRPFLLLGDDVVVGAGVKLSPHLLTRTDPGLSLLVAPIRIESGAVVGGYALFGPGTEVARGEATPAGRHLAPYRRWENGRRVAARSSGEAPRE